MLRVRREYQSWVANESLEDYALRYAASSYRGWKPGVVANTAIGGISFLALEAIGASITLSYGFQNALIAVLAVSVLIFLVSQPIAYCCSSSQQGFSARASNQTRTDDAMTFLPRGCAAVHCRGYPLRQEKGPQASARPLRDTPGMPVAKRIPASGASHENPHRSRSCRHIAA